MAKRDKRNLTTSFVIALAATIVNLFLGGSITWFAITAWMFFFYYSFFDKPKKKEEKKEEKKKD